MRRRTKWSLFIGGRWVPPLRGDEMPVFSPADGEVIATVAKADAADVDRAVSAARDAYPAWRALTPADRAEVLRRLADRMAEAADELAELESRNAGKPIRMARAFDVAFSVDNARFFAGAARLSFTLGPGNYAPGTIRHTRREPLGVVAAIAPWNYPLNMAVWKVFPALAVGNAVVLKPASLTPLTALALADLTLAAGLPPGVLNVVTGPGDEVGTALVTHPDVRMVALTGDTATGRAVMRQAADGVKRLHLELGGKAPFVVLADADLDAAAHGAVQGAFLNAGQDCTAATRVYCQEAVFDAFLERLLAVVRTVRLGRPEDPATEVGPLISATQRERVEGFVARARSAGATVLAGGRRPDRPDLQRGFSYEPTVLLPKSPSDEIVQQEVFGPVLAVLPFDTEADAIRLANDTPYGLAASVWTRDVYAAERLVAAIEAGTVWVNDHITIASEMPHGGAKASGFGKDMSFLALEEYTQVKHVLMDLTGAAVRAGTLVGRGVPQ